MEKMNLGMYEAAVESIKVEAWDALWDDSYLWGDKRVRDLLVNDGEEVCLREGVSSSLVQARVDEIFSGY